MAIKTYSLGRELFRIRQKRVRVEVEIGILWISGRKGADYVLCAGEERSFNEKDLVIEGLTELNFFRLVGESRFSRTRRDKGVPEDNRSSRASGRGSTCGREDSESWISRTEYPWEGHGPAASQSSPARYSE